LKTSLLFLSCFCRTGLEKSVGLQWRNPAKGGPPTSALTEEYISQLSEPVYREIVNLYRADFAIFGYQPLDWHEVRRRLERSTLR
jgi:hypothetical protein